MPDEEPNPDSPVALVTGGGTGIGAACCRALAAEGFRVAVHHRRSAQAAEELAGQLPGAVAIQADLTRLDEVDTLVEAIRDSPGRLDLLVNNAGHNVPGLVATMPVESFDAIEGLTRGTWYLTKQVLRRFMLRSGGRIVNITSLASRVGNRGQAPYSMAKAGLEAMTRTLAAELAGRPILVNAVAPGLVETAMVSDLDPEERRRILEQVPLARPGRPDEVADVVAWLATRASYVNGSVIHVNGGCYG